MSGRFPDLFSTRQTDAQLSFEARALNELATCDSLRADDILEAVKQDIDGARRDGLTTNDTIVGVSVGFNALLDRLSPQEKLRFASDTGPRIGALQRRAGQEYLAVIDRLIAAGKLVITRSRFPVDTSTDHPEPEDLLAIINCSGGERLSSAQLRSELIRNLLARAWVRQSGSDFGIRVNDDLETETPGLYAIGPMLTGNVVENDATWNLEHCGRIARFARQLAAHLVDRTFAEVST